MFVGSVDENIYYNTCVQIKFLHNIMYASCLYTQWASAMAAVTVSSSPPSRRAYSESHSKHPLHSPLGRVTRHMTNHVIPSTQYQSDPAKPSAVEEVRVSSEVRGEREGRGEGSGESTAEEVDMPPNESTTTTDTLPEANEPVDFIECDHALPRAYSTSILPHNGHGHIPRVIASSGLQVGIHWAVGVVSSLGLTAHLD